MICNKSIIDLQDNPLSPNNWKLHGHFPTVSFSDDKVR